jgi:hypothetical protein
MTLQSAPRVLPCKNPINSVYLAACGHAVVTCSMFVVVLEGR